VGVVEEALPEGSAAGAPLAAERARRDFESVEDDPAARLEFARRFYLESPDGVVHGFGASELAFMEWEIRRGVLDRRHATATPGSPWWRAVNGRLLLDAQEAFILRGGANGDARAGETKGSNPGVAAWLRFLDGPSPPGWYRAHNTSICLGYLDTAGLARRESGHEQKLMNIVLYRVLFTQAVVDRQPWTFGRLTGRFSPLFDPESGLVSKVVKDRSLYPCSYPLDRADCDRLDRRLNHLGDVFPSVVDLAFIRTRLHRLYDFMAHDLAVPRITELCDLLMPCYPWGLHLDANELVAIHATDHPGPFMRMTARLIDLGRS
jgi:hypothetical protein